MMRWTWAWAKWGRFGLGLAPGLCNVLHWPLHLDIHIDICGVDKFLWDNIKFIINSNWLSL